MLCPKCNVENSPDAKFCSKCGTGLIATRHGVDDDDFELQPVESKPSHGEQQGPPRIDLDADPEDIAAATSAPKKTDKKPAKPVPERPDDHMREAKLLMKVFAGLILLPLFFNLLGQVDYCGHGFPNIVGLIFGGLALLEALKVDEYYKAGDYEGAEKASYDAKKWIKIAWIAAAISLVLIISIQVIWHVMTAISKVVAPKTDTP